MEHQHEGRCHQPEELLEQLQIGLAFDDEGVRVEDEESAPFHTEVQADDAEVHDDELCETKHDTEPLAQALHHAGPY